MVHLSDILDDGFGMFRTYTLNEGPDKHNLEAALKPR